MKRTALVIPVLAATAVVSTGCVTVEGASFTDGPHDSVIEVTGAGRVEKLSYALPGDKEPTTATNVLLPFTKAARGTKAGSVKVTVTPTQPGVSCKIEVDQRTVVTKQGRPNQELTCSAEVKD
jgi:hypothetical protein